MSIFELHLEGDAFAGLRTDFNQLLRDILQNMEHYETEDAQMTVKLDISLIKSMTEDYREIVKPQFKHKITTVMKLQNDKSGFLDGDYELVWDKNKGDYVMIALGGEQVSIDEMLDGDYRALADEEEYGDE